MRKKQNIYNLEEKIIDEEHVMSNIEVNDIELDDKDISKKIRAVKHRTNEMKIKLRQKQKEKERLKRKTARLKRRREELLKEREYLLEQVKKISPNFSRLAVYSKFTTLSTQIPKYIALYSPAHAPSQEVNSRKSV